MIPVQVVGLGMSPADLTPKVQEIIREAQVLVGGRRLLDYFPEHRSMKIPLGKDPEGTLKQLPALAAIKQVVVLGYRRKSYTIPSEAEIETAKNAAILALESLSGREGA
mgnify:CR=1 FL=1